jgi:hypothetical protein
MRMTVIIVLFNIYYQAYVDRYAFIVYHNNAECTAPTLECGSALIMMTFRLDLIVELTPQELTNFLSF